ncbi:hypothetical protein HK405_010867, partial [Cladochytrium tenue]
DIRLAIAGRSQSKLEDVRDKILEKGLSRAREVQILLADSSDQESLDALVARAEVVLSTVGM